MAWLCWPRAFATWGFCCGEYSLCLVFLIHVTPGIHLTAEETYTLSENKRKVLGTVHSVGLVTFLWAASTGLVISVTFIVKSPGDFGHPFVCTHAFQVSELGVSLRQLNLSQNLHAVGKECVHYMGRFVGILANQSCKGVRGMKLVLKSVGIESFKNGCSQGKKWEMCRWTDVSNELHSYGFWYSALT